MVVTAIFDRSWWFSTDSGGFLLEAMVSRLRGMGIIYIKYIVCVCDRSGEFYFYFCFLVFF